MDLTRLGIAGAPSVEIRDLAYDARSVTPGALFFCIKGANVDGHDLAAQPSRQARPRSSSSTASTSPSRRCSCRASAPRWGRPPHASSATRRASSRSRRSPARTARRRPRSCSTRSSSRRAGGPALLTNIERRVGGESRPTGLNTPGVDRPATAVPRDARRRRPFVRDGGDLDREHRRDGSPARNSRFSSSRT